ncbi:UPF0182 family membrane protein [Heliorestis convoluta]|uniref:UPF0182 protein FTV88_2176 n=1 Tax=Heliorestis convoluta TaxID=356322 RepID=A0A5Q2MZ73_9FIRM|nr:UPF0182 family protein [Heliorestis convoluta]QGG48274.1 hypothetical protein FTV88_2176 [Heliorestis convoluta]
MSNLNRRNLSILGIVLVVALVIPFFKSLLGLYVDFQWFRAEGYQEVWVTQWITSLLLHLGVGLFAFAFIYINLSLTRTVVEKALRYNANAVNEPKVVDLTNYVNPNHLNKIFFGISFFLAFLISQTMSGQWSKVLLALQSQEFAIADPLLNKDVSFYLFQLPALELLYFVISTIIVLTALLLFAVYQGANTLGFGKISWSDLPRARYHLAALGAFFFLLKAFGYQLDIYNLVYSPRGVVFGASYTDVHAQLPAFQILTVLAVLTALILVLSLVLKRIRWALYSVGVLLLASLLIGQIYPNMIQRFRVEPNEFVMEKPYIDMNIEFTRLAYGLNNIEQVPFSATNNLTANDILANKDTINNIRLWDWRPLQQTYSQMQEIRLYYKLREIDIDRYMINGELRQVMLAARELDTSALPTTAQTWINRHLIYTHGYGVAMSPVNEVTSEGLPTFFLKDIPPRAEADTVEITRPEIYFGEATNDYVIVKTATKEFDYPSGNDNVFTTYQADAGVPIGSLWQRLVFALYYGDARIVLSKEILPESQLLMNRNISERLEKVAPFLRFDRDPYLVIHDGRLVWIADAYTTSSQYPFSQPTRGVGNYIRNAVKATVDAYTGEITFYISDASDPIIQSYQSIFPNAFRSLDEMPETMRSHIRYPEDMFNVQSSIYATYHMQDAGIFYNREDEWNLPRLASGGDSNLWMEPYYTLMTLPGEDEPEFILMTPFTPAKRDNMIAWMAARSDGENYGKLIVYTFPKQELIYGPAQIEARINQDSYIAQNMALWNQRSSSVIRGNLLVLPINESLLYVQPLFLQAEQGRLPALRRVIVVYGERVVMEETLDQALQKIFGQSGLTGTGATAPTGESTGATQEMGETSLVEATVSQLASEARKLYDEANERLKAGDWNGYGLKLQELERILLELERKAP